VSRSGIAITASDRHLPEQVINVTLHHQRPLQPPQAIHKQQPETMGTVKDGVYGEMTQPKRRVYCRLGQW
jgi:hypothetical protein